MVVVRLAGLYPVPIRQCSARSARPSITNKLFKHLPYPSCGYYVKSFTLTLYTPTSFNHDLFDFIRICSGENLPLLQPALWISHNGFWESFRLWDSSCHHSYLQMVHAIFSRRSKCGENFSFSVFEHTLHRIQIRPWGKYRRELYSYFFDKWTLLLRRSWYPDGMHSLFLASAGNFSSAEILKSYLFQPGGA